MCRVLNTGIPRLARGKRAKEQSLIGILGPHQRQRPPGFFEPSPRFKEEETLIWFFLFPGLVPA